MFDYSARVNLLRNFRQHSEGFTLIEILFAITIFAVALLAIAQMQIMAMGTNSFANRLTTASTLAQDKIEELRGLSFDDAQLSAGDHPDDLSATQWNYYTRVWNIQNNSPVPDMKTVTVTVSCPGHQVQLETVVCDN
jgi:type IV pilus assembly protein PilV